MSNALSAKYNVPADKVVSLKEVRARGKQLLKANLSLGEKAYLNVVDKPVSVVIGLTRGIKQVFNSRATCAKLIALNTDGTPGVYRGEKGAYVTVATLEHLVQGSERYTLSKSLQAKITGAAVQAIQEARDYAADRAAGKLKSVKFGG